MASLFAVVIVGLGGLPEGLQGLLQTMLVVRLAWALGDWPGRVACSRRRSRRNRLLEAERESARRAVQDERERIARELHDIVTHHVSVIVIQAGAGLTALDRRPERRGAPRGHRPDQPRGADRHAPDARHPGRRAGTARPDDARAPMPGLERLGELIEEVRAAGLPVELSMEGERRPLDAGIELSAYRIVQEALTNALKHARGARARVRLALRAARHRDRGDRRGRHGATRPRRAARAAAAA